MTLSTNEKIKERIGLLSRLMMGFFALMIVIGGGISNLILTQRNPELFNTGIGMFEWGLVLFVVTVVIFGGLYAKVSSLINTQEGGS